MVGDSRTTKITDACLIACLDAMQEGWMVSSEHGKILYFNEAYRRLTKLGDRLFPGDNIRRFQKSGFIESEPTCLEAVRKRTKVIRQHAQDSNGVFIISHSEPIFDTHKSIAYVVTEVHDVTEFFEIRDDIENIRRSLERLATQKDALDHYGPGIVAVSLEMQRILDLAIKIAKFDISVVLTGESGAGKDVAARFIHEHSARKNGPFIAVNCAAIPDTLLETELFGYAEGTFTGQVKKGKRGLFEMARGGTLFLDEIGDMPLNLQAKLLRVLETGTFAPVGSHELIEADVRIVSATNRNLKRMIQNEQFREDLFFRLAVIQLEVPPLRKRKEDIIPLVMLFIDQFNQKYHLHKSITPVMLQKLQDRAWPGNVRELRNTIERMMVVSGDAFLEWPYGFEAEPPEAATAQKSPSEYRGGEVLEPPLEPLKQHVAALEKAYIEKAYHKLGTTRKAARALGIDHSTIIRKMKKYGIAATKNDGKNAPVGD